MAYNQMFRKPETVSEEKRRDCLFCKTSFISIWSGNRICAKCKTSQLFKAGGRPDRTI